MMATFIYDTPHLYKYIKHSHVVFTTIMLYRLSSLHYPKVKNRYKCYFLGVLKIVAKDKIRCDVSEKIN